MGFETCLDKIKKNGSSHFNITKIVSIFLTILVSLNSSLMQPSKNTVFACFYALFDQYYVKRWDLKLIEIKLRKMDHIISISPKLSAYF